MFSSPFSCLWGTVSRMPVRRRINQLFSHRTTETWCWFDWACCICFSALQHSGPFLFIFSLKSRFSYNSTLDDFSILFFWSTWKLGQPLTNLCTQQFCQLYGLYKGDCIPQGTFLVRRTVSFQPVTFEIAGCQEKLANLDSIYLNDVLCTLSNHFIGNRPR